MKKTLLKSIFVANALVLSLYLSSAQPVRTLSVTANKPLAEIQPNMWGIFFEDINFGADGGIYAELVKNRSFEFYKPFMGWKEIKQGEAKGKFLILNRGGADTVNQRYVRITTDTEQGSYGLSNEGFRGIGVVKDKTYDFSIFARKSGDSNVGLRIELVNSKGEKMGEAALAQFTNEWALYSASIQSTATEPKAKLNVLLNGKGSLEIDMVSLFPHDTWKNRKNGLRSDLVQMLYDLKPGFMRFPGGCIVEGQNLSNRYQWKKTIGSPQNRQLILNRWNNEFSNRSASDYYQSFGLGFFEYFQLAEDIGAEPLPIINCGMACQYNSGELVSIDQLQPYIQDALDLIEFANGPADSEWGKKRAEMGHIAPFNLKLLGVGNEQWGEQYIERYEVFSKAIKAKYPNIKLITSAGPSPDGELFDYLWGKLKGLNADLIDEHYYKEPGWFLSQAARYDKYDRKGPKVFAGEYACHSKRESAVPESRNNWESALAEAALMTGLERNADVVHMASYAPLFGHVDAWQWRPDLIWFDNIRVVGTPNYYVQKLFSNHKGTHVISVLNNGTVIAGKDSLYASASIDKNTNEVFLKVINVSSVPISLEMKIEGVSFNSNAVEYEVMTSSDPYVYNTLDTPDKIIPVKKTINASGNKLATTIDARSVNVFTVSCKKL